MKFTSTLYIIATLGLTMLIAWALQAEIKPQDNPKSIAFQPAYNIAIGPKTIIAAYPVAGVEFTLNYAAGRLYIGTETGLRIEDADVFRLDSVTWTAVMPDGDWVTVNAETGQTEQYMDGEYRCWTREISKP